MDKRIAAVACGAAVVTMGLSGCGASFEGSGSKDAASAEQLAMHAPDPWSEQVQVNPLAKANGQFRDGIYTGSAPAMAGNVGVTLLIEDNRITCLETTQDGETQSVGGFEAIRDGKYALMIEAAQGSDIDAISGATITTAAVRNAVDVALDQARIGVEPGANAETSANSEAGAAASSASPSAAPTATTSTAGN